MRTLQNSTQTLVVTKDSEFLEAVTREIRATSRGARSWRQLRDVGEVPPSVGLGDLVLIDARSCREEVADLLALPCSKIILNGPTDEALRELRLTLITAAGTRGNAGGPPRRTARQPLSQTGDSEPQQGRSERTLDEDPRTTAEAVGAPTCVVRPDGPNVSANDPRHPTVPIGHSPRWQMLLSLACKLSTLKPEKITDACREFLPVLVGARKASGYLYDPATSRLKLAWRVPDDPIAETISLSPFRTNSPSAVAANRRQVWYAEDVDSELTALGIAVRRPHARRYQTGSCIVAPIVYGAELIGLINFADPIDAKPFNRRQLEPLIEGLTHLLAATWQNVGTVESLEQLARTDGLTGLGNYRAFEETIGKEVTRARRYGLPLSLILMDVDNLKGVNDRFGHQAGDLLLREVGRRVSGAIRETDIAARQGGDEFSVILPSTNLNAARQVVARVTEAVNGVSVQWLRHIFATSVSVAYGQYDGESSVSRFLSQIDALLYERKPDTSPPVRS